MEKIKDDMIRIDNLAKTFLLHNQGAKKLPVFQNISFQVKAGECLVLTGASGTGNQHFYERYTLTIWSNLEQSTYGMKINGLISRQPHHMRCLILGKKRLVMSANFYVLFPEYPR